MTRKKSKPRSYFEPWAATKSVAHGANPPNVEGLPEEAAASLLDAWGRSDRDADWIVWGSGMIDPAIAVGHMSGKATVMDDRLIIAVRRNLAVPKEAPSNGDIAKRIAECVDAPGRRRPTRSRSSRTRERCLLAFATGEADDPRGDARVVSLLARCIPLSELEQVGYGHD